MTTRGPGLHVGLIEGRHPLPVDSYLVGQEAAEGLAAPAAVGALVGEIVFGIDRLAIGTGSVVNLYLTGLTRAAIIAVDRLRARGATVMLWEYDRDSDAYVHTLTYPS